MQAQLIKHNEGEYGLQGMLTFATVTSLGKTAKQLLCFDKNARIDCKELSHCDSAGIALLLQWKKDMQQKGKQLWFDSITNQMQQLICLMGLEKAFDL